MIYMLHWEYSHVHSNESWFVHSIESNIYLFYSINNSWFVCSIINIHRKKSGCIYPAMVIKVINTFVTTPAMLTGLANLQKSHQRIVNDFRFNYEKQTSNFWYIPTSALHKVQNRASSSSDTCRFSALHLSSITKHPHNKLPNKEILRPSLWDSTVSISCRPPSSILLLTNSPSEGATEEALADAENPAGDFRTDECPGFAQSFCVLKWELGVPFSNIPGSEGSMPVHRIYRSKTARAYIFYI